jgi:hypothetical protein
MDDTDTRRRQHSHAHSSPIRHRAAVTRHDPPVGGSRLSSDRSHPGIVGGVPTTETAMT